MQVKQCLVTISHHHFFTKVIGFLYSSRFRCNNLSFSLLFIYHWLILGSWRAGWVGYAWSRLRCDVYRFIEFKRKEIELTGRKPVKRHYGPGKLDPRVQQMD